MARASLAKVVVVLAALGLTTVGVASPAAARASFGVESITVEARPYGQNEFLYQTLTAPNGHTVQIRMPQPLADFWYGVENAVCTPANEPAGVAERDCTINNPNGTAMIRYKFPVAPEELADRTFTVTATDLDAASPTSSSATVSVVRKADLDLAYLIVAQAGSVGDFHPQIRYSYINHGPTAAAGVTLTMTFTGAVVFGSLPQGCSRAGMVVTCALGYVS